MKKNSNDFFSVIRSALSKKNITENNFSTLKFLMPLIALLFSCYTLKGQDSEMEMVDYKAFNAGLHLKNMHTWHGFVVEAGPVAATNLEFNSPNKKFTFGLWGGVSTDGDYTELSIYTLYRFSDKFFIEAVSHNNYTGIEENGGRLHYFGYDRYQPYNFVDLNFGYSITDAFSVYLATILGGGSRDFEVQNNGDAKNSYTHYLELKHKVWKKDDHSLSLFVGGAFSFLTDKTFYTDKKGNFVNIGAIFTKNIHIGSFSTPVELTAMWNPEKEIAVLQIDIAIF